MNSDPVLSVNVSVKIDKILFINEEENFLRLTYQFIKEWYNSYLTFQNLKMDFENKLTPREREMIWIPWLHLINSESREKCQKTDTLEILKVIPNSELNYKRNDYEENKNAFLFKVLSFQYINTAVF